MFSSTTSILICVAALWFAQRLLGIHQILQFNKQLSALRRKGSSSVGVAKRRGRRVYVALAFDERDAVTESLVLRGWTVFSRGRPQPVLTGCRARDLAAGRVPDRLPPLVVTATRQAAEFLVANRRSAAASPAVTPLTA